MFEFSRIESNSSIRVFENRRIESNGSIRMFEIFEEFDNPS
uniref:Uncharacterized protein n=1 Tax=Steinernema glaseri TaxID=37863 RepID=A0A1I7XWH0_9BILA